MVFTVVGAVFALGAAVMAVRQWRRLAGWTRITGIVIGYRLRRTIHNRRRRTVHHPRVRYVVAGRELVHESQVSTSRPRRTVGAEVRLRHDPTAPEQAYIDELGEQYFPHLLIGAIGVGFVLAGWWLR